MPGGMPQACLGYASGMPRVCLRHASGMPQACLRHASRHQDDAPKRAMTYA